MKMKTQYSIEPGRVKSNIQSFVEYDTFSFEPFESNIDGLVLILKKNYDLITQVSISHTNKPFSIPVTHYEYGWFEYIATDQAYLIDVFLE